MKIAILTTDNREHYKDYSAAVPYFGTAPEALLQGFARMRSVEVHVISCARGRMRSPEKLVENIFFHSLYVPKLGWLRTAYQGCIRAARKKLKEIRPDIVHGQGTERDCAISAIFSGYPNVVTIHGNMAELARLFHSRIGSFGWLAARLEDFTLRRTAGVFCNSEYTEGLVKPRARRTWRVANALREQFFIPGGEQARRAKRTLLNVGVVTARKRQVELLDMARELRQQGLDFELHFIGQAGPKSPYAARFLERIRRAETEGFARYLGPKSTSELIDCFDQADALVHFPSEEAFGLVVAEALARGMKLFGARVGGIIDITAAVPDAELFAVDDWSGLRSAVAHWIGKGGQRSSQAASLMRARYHPEIIARRHVEIYREVLSNDS